MSLFGDSGGESEEVEGEGLFSVFKTLGDKTGWWRSTSVGISKSNWEEAMGVGSPLPGVRVNRGDFKATGGRHNRRVRRFGWW